jgi:hypothetical protein
MVGLKIILNFGIFCQPDPGYGRRGRSCFPPLLLLYRERENIETVIVFIASTVRN